MGHYNDGGVELVRALQHEPERVTVDWADLVCPIAGLSDKERALLRPDVLGLVLHTLGDSVLLDGIRVGVTPIAMQQIADLLDAVVPTARLVDRRHQAARAAGLFVEPVFNHQGVIAANMDPVVYSSEVDIKIANLNPDGPGPVDGVGKSWVINPVAQTPTNYGWHSSQSWVTGQPVTPHTLKVAQPYWANGTGHGYTHHDPSQGVFALCSREALLITADGEELVSLSEVLSWPNLAPLVSHVGALSSTRIPGVSVLAPLPADRWPRSRLRVESIAMAPEVVS